MFYTILIKWKYNNIVIKVASGHIVPIMYWYLRSKVFLSASQGYIYHIIVFTGIKLIVMFYSIWSQNTLGLTSLIQPFVVLPYRTIHDLDGQKSHWESPIGMHTSTSSGILEVPPSPGSSILAMCTPLCHTPSEWATQCSSLQDIHSFRHKTRKYRQQWMPSNSMVSVFYTFMKITSWYVWALDLFTREYHIHVYGKVWDHVLPQPEAYYDKMILVVVPCYMLGVNIR